MKLANVFAAQAALARLAAMKMTPKAAYNVLKYTRLFDVEYDVIEKQRIALVMEISGAEEGQPASIEAGTPELEAFRTQFDEILSVDSELPLCPMTINALIGALDVSDSNTLSVQDMAVLEPLFEADAE